MIQTFHTRALAMHVRETTAQSHHAESNYILWVIDFRRVPSEDRKTFTRNQRFQTNSWTIRNPSSITKLFRDEKNKLLWLNINQLDQSLKHHLLWKFTYKWTLTNTAMQSKRLFSFHTKRRRLQLQTSSHPNLHKSTTIIFIKLLKPYNLQNCLSNTRPSNQEYHQNNVFFSLLRV
jgi:hypothetical protein